MVGIGIDLDILIKYDQLVEYNITVDKIRPLTPWVPNHQSLIWSQMAFAADMALESLRAARTAAPRFCTVCKRRKEESHD